MRMQRALGTGRRRELLLLWWLELRHMNLINFTGRV